MRISLLLLALGTAIELALARSSPGRSSSTSVSSAAPSRRSSSSSSSRGGGHGGPGRSGRSRDGGGSGRRHDPIDNADDVDVEEDDTGFDDVEVEDVEDDYDDGADEYDDDIVPATRSSSRTGGRGAPPPTRRGGDGPTRRQQGRRSVEEEEEEEEEYDYHEDRRARRGKGGGGGLPPSSRGSRSQRGPPSTSSSRRSSSDGRVVSYRRGPPPPSTFTRGLSAIRDRMPDPAIVKDTVLMATKAAQDRTAQLSATVYREMKGLTSSELEQVMLKATRPDDAPVKSKHVERLVGVTYQISGKYDIYDAVLRKLWNKMAEKDIRTKLKSVYVLHRFAVDGGPDHQEALKQRLRALRKTKDPKRLTGGGGGNRGGTRYFDSKVLIGSDDDPETQGYRAFLSRYAHYVLTRAQTFGGIFNEISPPTTASSSASTPTTKKGGSSKSKAARSADKPRNPPLCEEHLKFAQMVLKAGLACTLLDGEDSESTAMCVERVASDLMGLVSAVATALRRELKQPSPSSSMAGDEALVKQWCEFYSNKLLPETKKFCKSVTGKLDAYGLYLPSRMSATLSPELLEKGMKLGDGSTTAVTTLEDGLEKDDGKTVEVEPADEEKSSETCAAVEEEVDGDTITADASLAMKANVPSPEDEDEYDEEYDEYDDEYE